MARVTVEDCLDIIPNRFELVLLASRRARDISSGDSARVLRSNDKNSVIALREIAESSITPEELKGAVMKRLSTSVFMEHDDDFYVSPSAKILPHETKSQEDETTDSGL